MLSSCRDGIKAIDCNGRVIKRTRKKRPANELKSTWYAKKRDRDADNVLAKELSAHPPRSLRVDSTVCIGVDNVIHASPFFFFFFFF